MKLEFEKYIETVVKSRDAKELYNESIVCYKAGAYRASYLMSYLGFMESVRYKIMNSNRPENYAQGEWQSKIINKINNEEEWEKRLSEILVLSKDKKPIFDITEGIKTQLYYWKDRRNDCAHFKENKISYSHIEAFWLFIRSNFEKLSINGNVEDLLNKFKIHFDNSKTIPGTPYDNLIDECVRILEGRTTKDFIRKMFEEFENNFISNIDEIIYKIITKNDDIINNEIIGWIKLNKEDLKFEIIKKYPELLNHFDLSKSDIRNFWYEKLNTYYESDLNLICYLIKRGAIREQEKDEFLLKLLNNCYSVINKDNFECLKEYGFFEYFGANAFDKINDFNWANNHKDMILCYIETFGLQEVAVKNICREFNQSQNAWHLRDSLNEYFESNATKKEKFIEIAREKNFNLPSKIECFKEDIENMEE
ncbi:MAG: hypothetical protein WBG30_09095 [Psychrilyobacter sp.]|uniref:hypothetical protein n=1 Tax=Psychrilyobacter sp. TaxID=2586924 RepID=UPI003C77699A